MTDQVQIILNLDINLTRLIQANLDLFRSHLKAGQLLTQNFDAQKLFVDFLFS
jgi:hypothetical protein